MRWVGGGDDPYGNRSGTSDRGKECRWCAAGAKVGQHGQERPRQRPSPFIVTLYGVVQGRIWPEKLLRAKGGVATLIFSRLGRRHVSSTSPSPESLSVSVTGRRQLFFQRRVESTGARYLLPGADATGPASRPPQGTTAAPTPWAAIQGSGVTHSLLLPLTAGPRGPAGLFVRRTPPGPRRPRGRRRGGGSPARPRACSTA